MNLNNGETISDEIIFLIDLHYPGGFKQFNETFSLDYANSCPTNRHEFLTQLIGVLNKEKYEMANIIQMNNKLLGNKINNNLKQQHYFPGNTIKCSIFVNLKQSKIRPIDNMWKILLNGQKPEHNIPHLTLFECEFNNKHPKWNLFNFNTFCENIYNLHKNTFITNCNLICNGFGLLGRQEINKFFVQTYDKSKCPTHIGNIKTNFLKFKTDFFKIINNMFGFYSSTQNDKYKTYTVNDQILLAVPEYYSDSMWNPHVTILNIGDIKQSNIELYKTLIKNDNLKPNANFILENMLTNINIGNINMMTDIESITINFRGAVYNAEKTIKL